MDDAQDITQTFQEHRNYLFGIAYRMLGSATEAEDIVQEAFLRWLQADERDVQTPKAYLATIVTRLCINQEKSARSQREVYIGNWLPEPIPTGEENELSERAIVKESLSFAFLIVLERLSTLERAVFLLREVFEYEYSEIASIVEKSESNCRQIFRRAQQHLEQQHTRFHASNQQRELVTAQFLQATQTGNVQALLTLLSDDVVFTSDSAGKVRTALKPIYGPDKVTRGALGFLRSIAPHLIASIQEINGQQAIVGYDNDRPYGVFFLDIDGEKIKRIYAVLNPDKLQRIQNNPLSS